MAAIIKLYISYNYNEYNNAIQEFYDISNWSEGIPYPIAPKTEQYKEFRFSTNDDETASGAEVLHADPDYSENNEEKTSILRDKFEKLYESN